MGCLKLTNLICLLVCIDQAASWTNRADSHGGRNASRRGRRRTTSTSTSAGPTPGSSAIPPPDHDDDDAKKSIADYAMGLHGGKYQFDDPALSAAGRDFAASLYAAASGDEATTVVDYASEPWPAWAVRLSEWTAVDCCANNDNASVQPLPAGGQVTIVNEEMTWERYYAFIVPHREDDAAGFSVEPWVGMLAPRGGMVALKVTSASASSDGPSWLVVGTESERWIYSLPPTP